MLIPLSGMPPWLEDVLLATGLLAATAYATEPVVVLARRRRRRDVSELSDANEGRTKRNAEDIRAASGYTSPYTEAQGDDPAITGEPPEEQALSQRPSRTGRVRPVTAGQ